jgi:hypothetical protein
MGEVYMKELLSKLTAALDTHSQGFSARKLSAFVIIICCIAAHIKWMALGDFAQLTTVLTIDYSFIGLCLGMTTYQAIKKDANTPTP